MGLGHVLEKARPWLRPKLFFLSRTLPGEPALGELASEDGAWLPDLHSGLLTSPSRCPMILCKGQHQASCGGKPSNLMQTAVTDGKSSPSPHLTTLATGATVDPQGTRIHPVPSFMGTGPAWLLNGSPPGSGALRPLTGGLGGPTAVLGEPERSFPHFLPSQPLPTFFIL